MAQAKETKSREHKQKRGAKQQEGHNPMSSVFNMDLVNVSAAANGILHKHTDCLHTRWERNLSVISNRFASGSRLRRCSTRVPSFSAPTCYSAPHSSLQRYFLPYISKPCSRLQVRATYFSIPGDVICASSLAQAPGQEYIRYGRRGFCMPATQALEPNS
jgi:hypothetical protein